MRSLLPLLELIPGLVCVDGVYNYTNTPNLSTFYSYARRVRSLTQRHTLRIHPQLLSIFSASTLSGLVSTRLASLDIQSLPAALSFTERLRRLDVDFGFKRRVAAPDETHLDNLRRVAPHLERVRLRGSADARLNPCLAQMSSLQSLTLRTGAFITMETLVALSALPSLRELDFDAGHVDSEALAAISWPNAEPFQSLQHLRISAGAEILRLFMTATHSACLHTLHLEAASDSAIDWKNVLSAIGDNTSYTLQDLTIEHHLNDLEDIDDIPLEEHTQSQAKSTHNIDRITVDTLRVLSRFDNLRKLIVDTTYPPDLSDVDMAELFGAGKRWPALMHLELGNLLTFECLPRACLPQTTLAGLASVANGLAALQTLAIPLDVASLPSASNDAFNNGLARLFISSPTPPTDTPRIARCLRSMFPSLTEVEGMNDEHITIYGGELKLPFLVLGGSVCQLFRITWQNRTLSTPSLGKRDKPLNNTATPYLYNVLREIHLIGRHELERRFVAALHDNDRAALLHNQDIRRSRREQLVRTREAVQDRQALDRRELVNELSRGGRDTWWGQRRRLDFGPVVVRRRVLEEVLKVLVEARFELGLRDWLGVGDKEVERVEFFDPVGRRTGGFRRLGDLDAR
uniref:Uncharacterized protein n=1 Tax=Mycena chlorophos TaxID=658473 RepID=A0ABQ0L3M9_MYCCL|nr:predicted protein [Mycena chlorophos]